MKVLPLYHGTSSHYLAFFQCKHIAVQAPYHKAALTLFREVWLLLHDFGCVPEWHEKEILDQVNGVANWQHGPLFVTPSRPTAIRYAESNAEHGGELLTLCRQALDKLYKHAPDKATELNNANNKLIPLLKGGGHPVLITFTNVDHTALLPEKTYDNVESTLAELEGLDDKMRNIRGQQKNFRLSWHEGIIVHISSV